MEALTPEELAVAAGTSTTCIERFCELGLLHPAGDDGSYPQSNLSRIRLLLAHEAMDVSVDAFTDSVRSGRFGLAFIDQLMPSPVRLLPETYGQMAARIDARPELVNATRHILGTAGASNDEQVREDDARIMELLVRAKGLGANEDQLERIIRTTAESVRHIVGAQRDFVDEVLVAPTMTSGATVAEALQSTAAARAEYRMIGTELTAILLRRFVEDAIFQSIVELGERAMHRDGIAGARALPIPAIAFADVSGYTAITETAGDEAAARAATCFAMLVDDLVISRGGRVVKLLGDGAMQYFPGVAAAVRCALELIDRAEPQGLPPIHVGVAAGPMVRRDGDYFGSVVNIAARVAGRAGPMEVLVTDEVVAACRNEPDLEFVGTGPTVLKNVARPLALHLAYHRLDTLNGSHPARRKPRT